MGRSAAGGRLGGGVTRGVTRVKGAGAAGAAAPPDCGGGGPGRPSPGAAAGAPGCAGCAGYPRYAARAGACKAAVVGGAAAAGDNVVTGRGGR